MKRPAFQFYPSDWRKDTALQFCSLAARGLWIEMMCIAHECEPYGYSMVNGRPMTTAQVGRLVGISEKECAKLLAELFDAGVPSRSDEGAIFSRRMVRDEDIRNKRAAGGSAGAEHGQKGASFGKKGGRPAKQETPQETPLGTPLTGDGRGVIYPPSEPPSEPPLKPPPSSSSSSSSVNPSEGIPSSQIPGSTDADSALLGEACRAMRNAGMPNLNQSDPNLSAAVAEGVTPAELADCVREFPRKPMAYVLATARGRRHDLAAQAPVGNARASPRNRPMTVSEGRAIAAGTRLADFRAAVEAEAQTQGASDERTIEAPAAPRPLG